MKIAFYITSNFSIIILVNYFIQNHLLDSFEYSLGYILLLELDKAVFFIFFLIEFYFFSFLTLLSTFFHYTSADLQATVTAYLLPIACLSLILPSLVLLILLIRQYKLFHGLNCDLYAVDCQANALASTSFQNCIPNYLLVTST